MKSGWRNAKLSELGFLGRGRSRHRPRNEPGLYGGPYPFVQTGEIKAADLYITQYTQTYSEKGLAQSKLWEPGTLCMTIAANIAETAILKIRACFPDSVVGFVADPAKSDVYFIKYCIDLLKLRMQNISRGTTQDNLSLEKIETFNLTVPRIHEQRRIASAILAYDDLIENNTRRIKILEEMAKMIYREWFVEFKAPGVRLRNATAEERKVTGKDVFPEGWEIKRFNDAVDVNPPTLVKNGVPKFYVSMSSLPENSMLIGQTEVRDGNSGSKFKNRDTLFARITPCLENGKTGYVQFLSTDHESAIGSTEFIVLREKLVPAEFVYLTSRLDSFRNNAIKSMSGASGRQRVQERCFDTWFFGVPTNSLLDSFVEFIRPIFKEIQALCDQNVNLRQTRDFLLPKLVSGEVEV